MRCFQSIGWRLQLWHGLLLAVILAGFGVTAHRFERARLMRRIDDELEQRIPVLVESQRPVRGERERRVFSLAPRHAGLFDGDGPQPFYHVVWLKHGVEPVTRSAASPAEVPMPRPGEPTVRQRGSLREAFLFPGPGDCVLVGRRVDQDLDGQDQLAWKLAAVGIGVLALGLAIGSWLVRRALMPIHGISDAAVRIASGDLTRRIPAPESADELGQLAEVLNSTFDRLDAAFARQTRFTADAAHELRTPVAVLLTQTANGLAAEGLGEDQREALEACQRAAQRMRRLIDSLLLLARLDAGRTGGRREPCDLSSLALETLKLIRPLADRRRIGIDADLPPATCLGDPAQLEQVLANLVSNAVDHNEDDGRIRVTTGMAGGMAVVTVWNSGPPIPQGDLPRIFERFHRVDRSRTSGHGHTGLGLAIVQGIVQAHGGRVEARSGIGDGTRFRVELPAAHGEDTVQGGLERA